ncbi:iron(III) transport system substrate-binding protein [Desulfonatronum thiosulfatophilum]|uniref:Iron(III) transport system substrate-binding protein n=1 Tax=Desulfonatronum thiosulfatophilum TaxID=617002 RepID=A0A1G6EW35_9BACT|nr:Fe(3+) ABC transporter substrate-binding protein [Desulfonatronum thiosulfatophilum]SDB61601.1 iron(III) transport system substrate-binding protein [Desulfonatronum thiosulfatophilum]
MPNKKKTARKLRIVFSLLTLLLVVPGVHSAFSAEVNIYSARQEHLIKPLLDEFSAQTGITANLLTGEGPALLERLRSEGRNSPADVLITVDVGNLVAAKQAGVLQSVQSDVLERNIPAQYRDDEGQWFGLSSRARIIYYDAERVDPARISTYEALADPDLGKVICVRSSSNVYNQSMVAALIAHHGVEKTEEWARGFVRNFARTPQDNDTAQIRAVASGECAVGIANSYYFGRLLASDNPADQEVTRKVSLVWPNQDDRGTHMNLSGAGVTQSARNIPQAVALLEFLSGESAQEIYARDNNEYPVNPDVKPSGSVVQMGEFKADDLNLSLIEKYNAEAVRVMDRAGWR